MQLQELEQMVINCKGKLAFCFDADKKKIQVLYTHTKYNTPFMTYFFPEECTKKNVYLFIIKVLEYILSIPLISKAQQKIQ